MLQFVKLYLDLVSSPKLLKLAKSTKGKHAALGVVSHLWILTALHYQDGNIPEDAETLALMLDTKEDVIAALVTARFLETQPGGGFTVHGWDDRQEIAKMKARRASEAERQKRIRAERTGTVQRMPPVHTHPDIDIDMEQEKTRQEKYVSGGTGIIHLEWAGLILANWPPEKACRPEAVVRAVRDEPFSLSLARRIAESARRWTTEMEAQGNRKFMQRLDTWIASGAWRREPPSGNAQRQAFRGGKMDDGAWAAMMDAARNADLLLNRGDNNETD